MSNFNKVSLKIILLNYALVKSNNEVNPISSCILDKEVFRVSPPESVQKLRIVE